MACGLTMGTFGGLTEDCPEVKIVIDEKSGGDPRDLGTFDPLDHPDCDKKLTMAPVDDAETYDVEDVSTPQAFQRNLEHYRPIIGRLFHTPDDFEDFMKLPISKEQRADLLKKLTTVGKGAKRRPC